MDPPLTRNKLACITSRLCPIKTDVQFSSVQFGDIFTTDFGGKIEKEANVDIITCMYTFHIATYTINTLLNNKINQWKM